MAVNPDDVHAISIATVTQYREAELYLLRLIASYLARGMDAPTWAEDRLAAVSALRAAAQDVLGGLEQDLGPAVRQQVAEAYRTGLGAAMTDLPSELATQLAAQTATFATVTRTAALESLASAVFRDVGERHSNVLRHVIDVYRAVVAQASAVGVAAGLTRRQASQYAYDRFVRQGVVSFTDAGGRTWRLSSYVEMALRTVNQRAAVQGQTDRLESLGLDLVIISDSPGECALCRPWEGKVLSIAGGATGRVQHRSVTTGRLVYVEVDGTLAEARALGLFHPNCTHAARAFLPGATVRPKGDLSDPELNKAKERQREIERHIRGWKERDAAALTPEAKTAAARKVRAWQGEMRKHLEENPKLKRLPYREQIGAGNLPPRGDSNGGPKRRPSSGPTGPDEPVVVRPGTPAKTFALPTRPTLAERVKTGIVHRETLPGGRNAVTELVTYGDGSRGVRKTFKDLEGTKARAQADAEELGPMTMRAFGQRAPEAWRESARVIHLDFLEGKTAVTLPRQPTIPEGYYDGDNARIIGLVDAVTDNYDRNPGNWMLTPDESLTDDERLAVIDFGLAYTWFGSHAPQWAPIGGTLNPFTRFLSADGLGNGWADNDLSPQDIATARIIMESLRPEYERLGRLDWYEKGLERLGFIGQHARGTRVRIRR